MPQDFLEFIVKNIIDFPEEVVTRIVEDDRGICIFLKVAKRDMGRVLGVQGGTVESIRSILRAYSYRHNLPKISLKVEE